LENIVCDFCPVGLNYLQGFLANGHLKQPQTSILLHVHTTAIINKHFSCTVTRITTSS